MAAAAFVADAKQCFANIYPIKECLIGEAMSCAAWMCPHATVPSHLL